MESLYTSISSYYLPKEESYEMTSDTVLFGNRVFEKGTHSFQDFLDYTKSLFWFSYRKDFQPILPSNYTSDMGWGCMLRSGQMMLSQSFLRHYLGSNWESKSIEDFQQTAIRILKMFEDIPTAPYSIHKIAQSGVKFHKNIGEWFAPSTVSQVLCDLTKIHQPEGLTIYVSNDQVLYRDEIFKLCRNRKNNSWKSVIILIPLRLGLDTINDVYYDNLLKIFNVPQSLGIIGGKPRAAMYFVGYQDQCLYYLDPHTVQPYQPFGDEIPKSTMDTYHCQNLGKMSISSLDPSLALGFYCSDRSDFEDFWRRVSKMSSEENALFTVADEAPEYRSIAKAKSLTLEDFEQDLVIL